MLSCKQMKQYLQDLLHSLLLGPKAYTANALAYTLTTIFSFMYQCLFTNQSLSSPSVFLHELNGGHGCGLLTGDCTVTCCFCPCLLFRITVCIVLWSLKRLAEKMKITVAMKRRGRLEKEEVFGGERVHVAEDRMFSVETSFSFGR